MPTLRLKHLPRIFLKNKTLRFCPLCGGEHSETNSETSETNWYGRPYPEKMMIQENGIWYCRPHYRWKHKRNYNVIVDEPFSDYVAPITNISSPQSITFYSPETTWEALYDVIIDDGLEEWTTATDLTNWTEGISGSPKGYIYRESTEVYEGNYSCAFYTERQGEYASIWRDFNLSPGTPAKILVWYKRPVATGSDFRLEVRVNPTGINLLLKSDGTWSSHTSDYIPLSEVDVWTEYIISFNAHNDYSDYSIKLYKDHASGGPSIFYADHVTVLGTAV